MAPLSLGELIKYVMLVIAVLAVTYVIVMATGIVVPYYIYQVLWILLAVVVGFAAVNFLMSMNKS